MSESLFDPRYSARARERQHSLYEIIGGRINAARDRAMDVDEMLRWGHYYMALWKKDQNKIGDAPVQPEFIEKMRTLARGIDHHFNGGVFTGKEKRIGFILMVFPFGPTDASHRCNYMSNADRDDVVKMLREQISYFEAQDNEAKYAAHKQPGPIDPAFER